MSGEAIACAQHYKGLDAVLDRLPPKIIEIDGDGPREADADEVGGGDEGRGPRIERVRASIKAATFTGKGDDKVVVRLYNDYVTKIGNAMVASGEGIQPVYEGEYNAAGEREGYGTLRFAGGDVYEGQWKEVRLRGAARIVLLTATFTRESTRRVRKRARGTIAMPKATSTMASLRVASMGAAPTVMPTAAFRRRVQGDKMDGPGTLRGCRRQYCGQLLSGICTEGDGESPAAPSRLATLVGEGVKWSADRQTAVRLLDGQDQEEISLEEARRVAAEHGLPLPEGV